MEIKIKGKGIDAEFENIESEEEKANEDYWYKYNTQEDVLGYSALYN